MLAQGCGTHLFFPSIHSAMAGQAKAPLSIIKNGGKFFINDGEGLNYYRKLEEDEYARAAAGRASCEGNGLLNSATSAAREALDFLVNQFPLHGQARKNLGTALRCSCVRRALGAISTASGDSLLDELEYISAAADAGRHLTPTSINLAVDTLNGCIVFSARHGPGGRPPWRVRRRQRS